MRKAAMRRFIQEATAKRLWLIVLTVLAVAVLALATTAGHPQRALAATTDEDGLKVAPTPYAGVETEEYARGEPARYNLSSIQGAYNLQTLAGQATRTQIAFYNVDGNRAATIDFEVTAPQGWLVEVVWPGRTAGAAVLAVPPQLASAEPPALTTEEAGSIYLPDRGYVLTRVVEVVVTTPKGAVEQAATITVTALAAYSGQGGAASIAQSRDFRFNVQALAPDV